MAAFPRSNLFLRTNYFCGFAGLGALFPYLPVMFAHRGLSARQIARTMVIHPISNVAVPPIWGIAADTLGAPLRVLRYAFWGSAVSALPFAIVSGLRSAVVAVCAHSLFRPPLVPLADAVTHQILAHRADRFAWVRVFGSLGFIAAVLAVGGLAGSTHPWVLVITMLLVYSIGALTTYRIGEGSTITADNTPGLREVIGQLRRPSLWPLLLATTSYYTAHAGFDLFFGLHLKQLGYGDQRLGAAWAIGVSTEVLVMLATPRWIRHSRGLLGLCAALAALRWYLLARTDSFWAIALSQPLHGVTFGLWYLCLAREVQRAAPDHLRASHQSLATAAIGAGMVIGYLGGGELFERSGGPAVFSQAIGFSLAAGLLYGLRWALDRS